MVAKLEFKWSVPGEPLDAQAVALAFSDMLETLLSADVQAALAQGRAVTVNVKQEGDELDFKLSV